MNINTNKTEELENVIDEKATAASKPQKNVDESSQQRTSQFGLKGLLTWVTAVATLLGLLMAFFVGQFRTLGVAPEALCACIIVGICLLVISVGLPITVLQSFWIRNSGPLVHLRLEAKGMVVGTIVGAVVGGVSGWGIVTLMRSTFGLNYAYFDFLRALGFSLGSFFGAISGAFGGGLPGTSKGFLASLTLGMVGPVLLFVCKLRSVLDTRRSETLVLISILFVPAILASFTGRWARKVYNEILEEMRQEAMEQSQRRQKQTKTPRGSL